MHFNLYLLMNVQLAPVFDLLLAFISFILWEIMYVCHLSANTNKKKARTCNTFNIF